MCLTAVWLARSVCSCYQSSTQQVLLCMFVSVQDFSEYGKVADLGGGYGQLLMDILDMYPSK